MADKAASFGVNVYKYPGIPTLNGCVNDVESIRSLLTGVLGFDPKNVKTFTDSKVTKLEVQRQMKWLFRDVTPGDRVVFHLSGHGSSIADTDTDGDEPDGQDEIFCLHDMDFNDPDSYLVDDELRSWTGTLPAGVLLTVILDTCHSGTGTRLLMAPGIDGTPRPVRVDELATVKRSVAANGGTRGLELAATIQPDHPEVVRSRYIEPPPAVQAAIALARARAKPRTREFAQAPLNHVLLAACRSDQTAADATINGQPNGAFTYYLNQTIRAGGREIERQTLIDQVSQSLLAGHFNQIPQLEASSVAGPLFAKSASGPVAPTPDPNAPDPISDKQAVADEPVTVGLVKKIVGDGTGLDPAARGRALEILAKLVGGTTTTGATGRGVGQRTLVTVHGICRHPAGYSNPWWDALHPHTTVFGAGTLGDTRQEVLWSDIVNARALSIAACVISTPPKSPSRPSSPRGSAASSKTGPRPRGSRPAGTATWGGPGG